MMPIKIIISIVTLTGLVFYGSIAFTYGYMDDYIALVYYGSHSLDVLNNDVTYMGRPLYSLLNQSFFNLTDGFSTLNFTRLFGVLLISLLIIKSAEIIYQSTSSYFSSIAIGIILILNPSTGVFASWAISSISFSAHFLSYTAGVLFLYSTSIQTRSKRLWITFASALLLLISLSIYQQGVFLFLTPVILKTIYENKPIWAYRWFHSLILLSTCLVFYLITYKSLINLFEIETWSTQRGSFDFSKILTNKGFFDYPLKASFANWFIFLPSTWNKMGTLLIVIFSTLGIFQLKKENPKNIPFILIITLFIASYILSSVSLLLTQEHSPFRTFFFQYQLVFLLLTKGIQFFFYFLSKYKLGKGFLKWKHTALVSCVVSWCFLTSYFTHKGIILPQKQEFEKYKEFITHSEVKSVPEFSLFLIPYAVKPAFKNSIHEYGQFSSWVDWTPRPLLLMLYRDKIGLRPVPSNLREWEAFILLRIYPWQKHSKPSGTPFIDGRDVLLNEPTPPPISYKSIGNYNGRKSIEHQFLGQLEVLSEGWYFHENLEYLRLGPDPYFFHWSLGWIKWENSSLLLSVNPPLLSMTPEKFPEGIDLKSNDQVIIKTLGFQKFETDKNNRTFKN